MIKMQEPNLSQPDRNLSLKDRFIRIKISRLYKIDKNTFCNITPENWIKGLSLYHAMPEDWITCDPPPLPSKYILTQKGKVFTSLAEALRSIGLKPGSEDEAKTIALEIVRTSLIHPGSLWIDPEVKIDWKIPKKAADKMSIKPGIEKKGEDYIVILYSYSFAKPENKFNPGYSEIIRHTINTQDYSHKQEMIWKA